MQPLAILFGAAFTCAVSLALGGLLLRDACRDPGVRFVTGAAMLSLLVFLLCSAGLAYPLVFLRSALSAVAAAAAPIARASRPLRRAAMELVADPSSRAYFVLYLANAMAPEASPDGAGYHLGLVARYLREHGFVRITDNFYAAMPGGVEMLFLFAFAFGRHSAAALVHFTFLLALVWQIFSYARRARIPGGRRQRRAPGLRQPGGRHRRHQRL